MRVICGLRIEGVGLRRGNNVLEEKLEAIRRQRRGGPAIGEKKAPSNG
jgi:hypothetical protein